MAESSPIPHTTKELAFLEGGGELGARMRDHDWSSTPLGPAESWPRSLKTAVRIMLTSRQPFWLGWGDELTYLYNDPYKSIIGGKHPDALGKPFREVWSEIIDVVGPMADRVMTRDEGTYVEAQLLIMERHGYQEETYYTFSYSPIPNDDGGPGGLICANTDDTRRVIGERQLATLRELATCTANARDQREAFCRAVESLAFNQRDIPFALLYPPGACGGDGPVASTEGIDAPLPAEGWPDVHPSAAVEVDLSDYGDLPCGAWSTAPRKAVVLAVEVESQQPCKLVLGLNPFRPFDESYRSFVHLVAGQIAAAAANAMAYEHERRRAEELAQIDRAKTEFFSNVSHEFRTPLTLLLAPLESLLASPDLDEATHHALQPAHRNARRLLKLVNRLLDFSRVEAGRLDATFVPTDLGRLTRSLASLFESTTARAGLELVIDCAEGGPATWVDPTMWEKIVFNLVSNAFKFTFEGSIRVHLAYDDQHAVLSVLDTGTGIPAEELPRLFERFHRVEGASGRTFEGSGIGLSLVQELVRFHHGTVEVASEVERGTTFTVRLPLGSAHLPPERLGEPACTTEIRPQGEAYVQEMLGWLHDEVVAPPEAPTATDGPTLLLADDNSDMRAYLNRILSGTYRVVTVNDGQEALDTARTLRPDLILTDAMMPRLDGFGLIQAIRDDPELVHTPIILLSARAGEEARLEGIEAGADDYLAKPFSHRELLARLSARLELSRLERRIDEERLSLQQVFAQTPVATAVLRGEDLVFELANPGYIEVTAGRVKVGQTLAQCLPEVVEQGFGDLLRNVMKTGEPFVGREVELLLDRGAGPQKTYWTFIYAPLRNLDGKIDSVIAICSEVTDQVTARYAIADSERRYRNIFDTAAVGILEVDFSGVVDLLDLLTEHQPHVADYLSEHPEVVSLASATLEVIDGNAFAAQLLEVDEQAELLGPLERFFHPQTHDAIRDTLVAMATGDNVVEAETYLATAAGNVIHVLLSLAFSQSDPHQQRVLVTAVDVTARKEAEQALLESDRRKNEFIAMLGHELRNPLAAIRNAAQFIRRGSQRPAAMQQAISVLDRQTHHMGKLIDGLLDVSRISRGKIQLDRSAIDLASVLRAQVDDRADQLARSSLSLHVDLPDEPLWVDGDSVRLAQVFDNLLGNAIKFTPGGGEIHLTAHVRDGLAWVSLRDSGMGFSDAVAATIFQPFEQEPQSVARSAGGLGLGLALARGLVELHGGSISAHSQGHDKGACFEVRLPLGLPPDTVVEKPTVHPSPGRRVLVVEDNIDGAMMLQQLLELDGHQVVVVHDGPRALDTLRESDAFDAVVCDIGLPSMSGHEVAQRAREMPGRERLTMIALTGYGQDSDRRRAKDAGFDHHLLKPVDFDELGRLLQGSDARP